MSDLLEISPDLSLPLSMVTQTFAILAITGAGKSNAGAVVAEEMFAHSVPYVIIDPKGDYYGLRADADGTAGGLSIPIFGGMHGDLPLTEHMGVVVADLIVDLNLTCILDVSDFDSQAAQMRFLTAFGDRLFKRHARKRTPRHLILEEADEYLPQVVRNDQAKCVGVWTKIIKQGRQRGLGATIVSQRAAVVNKDALTQCANLIALRTVSALDRKAVKDWVAWHEQALEIVDSLPKLEDGESVICSPVWLPKQGMPVVMRFRWRRRWTFDSGATPELGEIAEPATLADIDLPTLSDRFAAIVEQAKADDPVALRARIAELTRDLRAAGNADGELERLRGELVRLRAALVTATSERDEARRQAAERPPPVRYPVPSPGDVEELSFAVGRAESLVEAMRQLRAQFTDDEAQALASIVAADSTPTARDAALDFVLPAPPSEQTPNLAEDLRRETRDRIEGRVHLPPGAQRMLEVVAAMGPVTRRQLSTLTQIALTGGTFRTYMSRLRTEGFIAESSDEIAITPAGDAWLPGNRAGAVSGDELLQMWRRRLPPGARLMLDEAVARYPNPITREELADKTGIALKGGTFRTYLSKLRSCGLVEVTSSSGVRASDLLSPGV